ncbi:ABC transporter permease subunit [Kaistia dalseonensis]|uniref:NitT/TauT family transport system permease protein n=1 Tax=Kaistia dalseonensis TaxID=410840 RepID=A0ABU0H848_9HYPH|nr:ABC transporter permease subunit [Kaistia dalseonensis]MCX5495884.1 ABC transporter permease subunit [Kaistia dalseonensis]MDQ0438485.1 NitT/TauT family transport system permease protein [Kaistia dalseonensis]
MRLINRRPSLGAARFLAIVPFALVLVAYLIGSGVRLAENPSDKLLPAFSSFAAAIDRMALTPDQRTGDILLWVDTAASLTRLGAALAISVAIGLVFGIVIGLLPYFRAGLGAFVAVISMVPPLALLPILFITLGLGETSKIALIVIGVAPCLIRDMALRVGDMPVQQLIKAQTLGASTWQIIIRVVLPQSLPRLIDSLRLQIGPAWLFLIAAEAIASESGLGYRIFLVRRYLAMDVILPYVAWITILAFLMDRILLIIQTRAFPWFAGARAST